VAVSIFGEFRQAERIETSIMGASAWKIWYRSADVVGTEHIVSSLVVAPSGTEGVERSVLTWCHGTTGLGDAACPSAQPDPVRELNNPTGWRRSRPVRPPSADRAARCSSVSTDSGRAP